MLFAAIKIQPTYIQALSHTAAAVGRSFVGIISLLSVRQDLVDQIYGGMKSKQLKLVITYEAASEGEAAALLMSLKIVQNEQNKWSIIEKGLRQSLLFGR